MLASGNTFSPSGVATFYFILHLTEMNELPRHILMLACLAFEMDIHEGIVFVQSKGDLAPLLKGLMSVSLRPVFI
jgi:hypothetical protein